MPPLQVDVLFRPSLSFFPLHPSRSRKGLQWVSNPRPPQDQLKSAPGCVSVC